MFVRQTALIPIVQPMIAPLYDSASKIEVLLALSWVVKSSVQPWLLSADPAAARCRHRSKTLLTRRFVTPLPLWPVVSTKRSGISLCATVF
jgi:hypothetical protein